MIINSEVLKWAKSYKGEKFHALLSDAPYELGFMNKKWDKSGIAFNPNTWKLLGKHLYPGAFGMVFGSSRGYHRLACAIEDAGMIIHPSLMLWAYSSGFPKATRIRTGEEIETDETTRYRTDIKNHGLHAGKQEHRTVENVKKKESYGMQKIWEEHRYGLQAIKPSVEPIIVFQKPYEGRPVDNITKTGAGALNIGGTRIKTDELTPRKNNNTKTLMNKGFENGKTIVVNPSPQGRWPANLILDEETAKLLDAKTGELKSGDNCIRTKPGEGYHGNIGKDGDEQVSYGDSGGASRFFFKVEEQIDEADPVFYCAKVSPSEREGGLRRFETKTRNRVNAGGLENDPKWKPVRVKNIHPTLKPIKLTEYLAKILLPPDHYAPRRLMIPFSGVGSEIIGADMAGWEEVIGIETDEYFCELAEARRVYWKQKNVKTEELFKE
jgi:hypothetical protein